MAALCEKIYLELDPPSETDIRADRERILQALALLLDAGKWEQVQRICEKAVYIQYGEMDRFLENMIAAQFLPHTDLSAYPSVERERKRRTGRG